MVSGILIVLFSLRWVGLKRPIQTELNPTFPAALTIIAHRGGALEAPENTLEAFSHAKSLSSDIVFELDLRQTKDKQIVVLHDPTVERTTNGQGSVADMTYDELQKLDAGFGFKTPSGERPFASKNVRIPKFEEVLAAFPQQRIIVEVKSDTPEIEKIIVEMIRKARAEERVVVGSYSASILRRFRSLAPELKYAASYEETLQALVLLGLKIAPIGKFAPDLFAIPETHQGVQVLSEDLLAEVQRRKKKLFVWTVNEEADMRRLLKMGVDGLITDRPTLLYKVLNSQ